MPANEAVMPAPETAQPPRAAEPAVPPAATYKEAGDQLRHYSTMRGSLVSFLFTAFFGLGGWALSNPGNAALAVYLLASQLIVLSCAIFSSLFFSANIRNMRRVLIALEGGERVNLYNRLDLFRLWKEVRPDHFDWFILFGGPLIYIGFLAYIVLK
jgi:hypothetical protein